MNGLTYNHLDVYVYVENGRILRVTSTLTFLGDHGKPNDTKTERLIQKYLSNKTLL